MRSRRFRLARLLLLLPLAGALGCGQLFAPEPGQSPEELFEDFWGTFDREYAGFADRGVDWTALYATHRPAVSASTTGPELFAILSSLVAELDDSHVSVTTPHGMFLSSLRSREGLERDRFNMRVIRDNYLEPGSSASHRESWVYGKLRDANAGYVYFGTVDASFAMLPRMMDSYPDASAYVVDLRQNTGGNHTFAFKHMARLTESRRFVFRSRTRNGPRRDDFTPWHRWYLEPGGRYVDTPIFVLTDRYTPSAAERAVMAFRTLPNAVIVGDTTNGATSTKIPRELANGWAYSLSPQQVRMFDGLSYEGRGIPPDVVVRNDPADVAAGKDEVLDVVSALVALAADTRAITIARRSLVSLVRRTPPDP